MSSIKAFPKTNLKIYQKEIRFCLKTYKIDLNLPKDAYFYNQKGEFYIGKLENK